jgi:hypothetical protein
MLAREAAIYKLRKIQKSPRYRSFFTDKAIKAFGDLKASAYAGKSRACAEKDADRPR